MNKKNKNKFQQQEQVSQNQETLHDQENKAPPVLWASFEQCWLVSVKNGKQIHFDACKAHVKSLGYLNKPDKWIAGIINFGIAVEE